MRGRRSARRRAAPVARDELQECDGRAAARRRQGGDPRRRGADQDAGDARRLRQGGRGPRRRAMSPPRMSASASPTWSRSRSRPAMLPACRSPAARSAAIRARTPARRLPRHQGGGEARARQGQPRRPPHRHPGRRQRRLRRRPAMPRPKARGSSIADVDEAKAQDARRARPAATVVAPDEIMTLEADVLSPMRARRDPHRRDRSPR